MPYIGIALLKFSKPSYVKEAWLAWFTAWCKGYVAYGTYGAKLFSPVEHGSWVDINCYQMCGRINDTYTIAVFPAVTNTVVTNICLGMV